MTAGGSPDPLGPYAFTLLPVEAEAAAARFGLRVALRGGLILSHLAPLAIFALALLFAAILALCGFVSRRAGELTFLIAAGAFMIQRMATHWRIRRARLGGRAAIAGLQSDEALTTTLDEGGVTQTGARRRRRLDYADCEDAEDAGGLIYLWPREGAPIVLPTRALAEGEAARLIGEIRAQIRRARIQQNRKAKASA
jgi:hypothetical protein